MYPEVEHFPCVWETDEATAREVYLLGVDLQDADCYLASISGEGGPMKVARHNGHIVSLPGVVCARPAKAKQ